MTHIYSVIFIYQKLYQVKILSQQQKLTDLWADCPRQRTMQTQSQTALR